MRPDYPKRTSSVKDRRVLENALCYLPIFSGSTVQICVLSPGIEQSPMHHPRPGAACIARVVQPHEAKVPAEDEREVALRRGGLSPAKEARSAPRPDVFGTCCLSPPLAGRPIFPLMALCPPRWER
jgi:hypothetical protein